MRDRDYKFFNVAREVAKLSTWSEIPREQTGAVIVLRNEIIATGYNRCKGNFTHGWAAKMVNRPEAAYSHAETSALHKASRLWMREPFELMKIYVYRETKEGLGIAKPCDICTFALRHFGIQNVFYTTDNGYAEEIWK